MYKCNDCGCEFEEPAVYYEHHEFWGMPCSETFHICPRCESEDYDEIEENEEEEEYDDED